MIAPKLLYKYLNLRYLPRRGLEPLRIAPPDPKSGASANFATSASVMRNANNARISTINKSWNNTDPHKPCRKTFPMLHLPGLIRAVTENAPEIRESRLFLCDRLNGHCSKVSSNF